MASAFVTQAFATAWPALIALAMFGANRVLGNWRTALVCAAGQVTGTLVSEAIAGYRVSRGLLPAADRYIIYVGPSYVVVSAIVVALLYGSWPARAAAALDLALLVVVGNIFGGLSHVDVAAVGHVTAMTVAAVGGKAAAPAAPPGPGPAPPLASQQSRTKIRYSRRKAPRINVTSEFPPTGASLSVVHVCPKNRKAVRPCGSQRGSQPQTTPGTVTPWSSSPLSALRLGSSYGEEPAGIEGRRFYGPSQLSSGQSS